MARAMDLEGEWRLEEQINAAVGFLYGAHYWAPVKKAVLSYDGEGAPLAETIRSIASSVAEAEKVDVALVLGISAIGLMTLSQLGQDTFEKTVDKPAEGELLAKNPDRVIARRKRESRDGLLTFLKGINRRYEIRWNERTKNGTFRAVTGQDLAMAGDRVEEEYRSLDYRRIAGPVPVECRVGSCGYCWIGLLEGRENLSEMSDHERERLAYFGYDTINDDNDEHPLIRLACQSQCHGDVTLAISPWNGELERRHQTGRKKLGTA
jgi:ferredoxin